MILERVAPWQSRDLEYRPAGDAWEVAAYLHLRRRAFCDEQRMFERDDIDDIDRRATFLVAVLRTAGVVDDVVGGVRIWQDSPGDWWGGRLVIHPDHRGTSGIARGLVHLAVSTACRRGCASFRATVQLRVQPLFERIGWTAIERLDLHGAPHMLVAADLARFGGGPS